MRHLMRRRTDVRSFFINPCMITQTSDSFIWQLSGCRSDGWCELNFFSKRSDKNLPPTPSGRAGRGHRSPQRGESFQIGVFGVRTTLRVWKFCQSMTKEKVTDLEMLILTLGQGSSSDRENWIGVDLAGACRCHVTTVVSRRNTDGRLRWRFLSSGLLILHLANRRQ
jgi:hypothetical protein